MTYRGYELRHVPYKAPHTPATTSLAVIGPDGRAHLVRDEETGKHVIDTMVKAGKWPEREDTNEAEHR